MEHKQTRSETVAKDQEVLMDIYNYIYSLWNRAKHDPDNQTEPNKSQHTAPPVVRAELHIPQAVIERYDARQKSDEESETWKRRADIGTLVTGLIGIILILATLQETRRATDAAIDAIAISQDVLKEAQEATKAAQRSAEADVAAARAWVNWEGSAYIGVQDSNIKVKMAFSNIGNTHALNAQLGVEFLLLPSRQGRIISDSWECPAVTPGAGVVGPDKPWINTVSRGPFTDAQLKEFAENKTFLYTRICVIYEDVLGNKDRTTKIGAYHYSSAKSPNFIVDPQNTQMK